MALTWGAICRIGEVLQARRSDLVLPQDVCYTSSSIFLRVREPKTRFKAARHQVAKLDYSDLVEYISTALGGLRPADKLWPFSGQLLRTRFKQILQAIGLQGGSTKAARGLDLGSLRAGGATHLLMICEDSELVRRRGRWLAPRTMECYLQEAGSTQFFPLLPSDLKTKITALALAFPKLLQKMKSFTGAKINPQVWPILFQRMETDGEDGLEPGQCRNGYGDQRRNSKDG